MLVEKVAACFVSLFGLVVFGVLVHNSIIIFTKQITIQYHGQEFIGCYGQSIKSVVTIWQISQPSFLVWFLLPPVVTFGQLALAY